MVKGMHYVYDTARIIIKGVKKRSGSALMTRL